MKKHNHSVGSLSYKSDYEAINLQQHRITYRFYDEHHIGLQGFKELIRIKGANQFWNIPDLAIQVLTNWEHYELEGLKALAAMLIE